MCKSMPMRAHLIRLWGIELVGDKHTKLPLPLHRAADGLLDLQPLPHDGGIQLLLKHEQVHVRLGLWDQITHLFNIQHETRYFLRKNKNSRTLRDKILSPNFRFFLKLNATD